mmetsp:Transcript_104954/g.338546  ORF Transcript_104954/g.338546 Transcript_104954/m.338546 type:complete len:88 (+) Transcript_104954:89-352(+)
MCPTILELRFFLLFCRISGSDAGRLLHVAFPSFYPICMFMNFSVRVQHCQRWHRKFSHRAKSRRGDWRCALDIRARYSIVHWLLPQW